MLTDYLGSGIKNFVFIGEAGCGKSEIAINFAISLKKLQDKEILFFDLDMTKPIFRSRDFENILKSEGVTCHFQQQFMDAPTTVGWVNTGLKNTDAYVVLDVGGDDIGARAIGKYASIINSNNTEVYFVINYFRPWSSNIDRIKNTYLKILDITHINSEKIKIISNPNIGADTTIEDFIYGEQKLEKILNKKDEIHFSCALKHIYEQLNKQKQNKVFVIQHHIVYP